MKNFFFALVISMLAVNGQAEPFAEVAQLKTDLIGHTMGGREKTWKFQSVDQIKDLVITDKTETGPLRTYFITLELQDPRAAGKYRAQAQVRYKKAATQWALQSVGLTSMTKIE